MHGNAGQRRIKKKSTTESEARARNNTTRLLAISGRLKCTAAIGNGLFVDHRPQSPSYFGWVGASVDL